MSWLRLDDSFLDHPKFIGLEASMLRVWLRALSYASRHDTDGFVPREVLPRLGATASTEARLKRAPPGYQAGLWEEAADGIQIHDYASYRPRGELTRAERKAAAAAAGRLGGLAKAAADAARKSSAESTHPCKASESFGSSKQTASNVLPDVASTDPSPDPTRPDPKEGDARVRALPPSERALQGPVWVEAYEQAAREVLEDPGWSFARDQLATLNRILSARAPRAKLVPWLSDTVRDFLTKAGPNLRFYAGGQPKGLARWLDAQRPDERNRKPAASEYVADEPPSGPALRPIHDPATAAEIRERLKSFGQGGARSG